MRKILLAMLFPLAAAAQVPMIEEAAPGTIVRTELTLQLSGKMLFDRNGRIDPVNLEASGKHNYVERIESEAKSLRYYFEATSMTTLGIERGTRSLGEEKRLIVVDRKADGPIHFSPGGPLTRDELSLVAEHFDAMKVPGLLPGKAVNIGETWPIRDEFAGALCLFDAVLKQSLTGKLVAVNGNVASFSIDGNAEGIEQGAKVKLAIAARGQFDLAAKRITNLTWEQADEREQGPVSPALEAKAKVTVSRTVPAEEPKELSPSIREKVAALKNIAAMSQLFYRHPEGKYSLLHDRDWHAVVQTESHLVLRLVRRGELIAQATIMPWKQADLKVKREDAIKEFLDATAKQPGWEPGQTLTSAEMPTEKTRTIYRHVASGKQDGLAVVQSFHLIANAEGRQVIMTCVARPELVEKLGSRDAALAAAIDFPAAK